MPIVKDRLADLLDDAMDLAVVPGFSAIGYGVRRRIQSWKAPDLTGRSVMVTGANSGLGKAAVIELGRCGASVHMVCRNPEKGDAARREVAAETGRDPALHICDISDLDSVRSFAEAFLAGGEPLDVLINNAGVMPEKRQHTEAGFELTFATNVLGPFLLTELLMPLLEKSDDGRVITVSSGGMYSSGFDLDDPQLTGRDYKPTSFYAHTKRAEVMLTEEWADRAGMDGPRFFSMHPGWAVTPGMSAALPGFHKLMGPVLRDTAQGADTAVWLCGATGIESGRFYHDRKERPVHRLPGTAETRQDRQRLYGICREMVDPVPD